MRPTGTLFRSHATTDPATRSMSAERERSHEKWFKFSREIFTSGSRRERLQNRKAGFSFPISSMNDFPIPEDPPVTTTAVYDFSSSLSEGTAGELSYPEFHRAGLTAGDRSNQTKRRNMNSQNNHELIVSGIHLELTPSLKTFVREKTERLFRHEERIVRIRVELECDANETVGTRFKAKGHIAIHGPNMNATVESDECHKAVSLLVDKLDRMLARRHQLQRVKRNHPHSVELTDALPKAI